MQQILLIVQVLLAASIITVVLLQQGRGADAGASFGGGSSGSLFGSRGPATFLAKLTGLMAAIFFVNSIGLAYLASKGRVDSSVIESIGTQNESLLLPPTDTNSGSVDDVPTVPGSADNVSSEGDVPTAPENSTKTE